MTDGQTDGQTDRLTDTQIDIQKSCRINGKDGLHRDLQTDIQKRSNNYLNRYAEIRTQADG